MATQQASQIFVNEFTFDCRWASLNIDRDMGEIDGLLLYR